MTNGLGTLGDLMPGELTSGSNMKNDEENYKELLDKEQITEKAALDKTEIISLKKSLKRPKRSAFNTKKEKEPNGMVEKHTELTIWRTNLLTKHKDAKKVNNAVELILHELQTRLKDKKIINNQMIATHMTKHYKNVVAFSGTDNKILKYTVQILSKITKALGSEKHIVEGEIDKPLMTSYRNNKRLAFNYKLNPEFFEHSAPALRAVVEIRYKIYLAESIVAKAEKQKTKTIQEHTQTTPPETIPETTGDSSHVDRSVVEYDIVDDTDKVDILKPKKLNNVTGVSELINEIVRLGGSIKIEINMNKD